MPRGGCDLRRKQTGERRHNSPRQTSPATFKKKVAYHWLDFTPPARQNAGVHVVDFVTATPSNGLNRLPGGTRVRKIHTHRYEQRVPGHQIQVDVKFLKFEDKDGKAIKRYQYTAIDDATRIRALKIYDQHNQANAIDFINSVIEKFPFRIREVRTHNGHEFQAKFHWHVEDHGIRHAYIRPASPQLNGKGERSHRTDEQEFYQLLSYIGYVDLNAKLDEWERFYNLARPHGAFKGKAPYEILREKL